MADTSAESKVKLKRFILLGLLVIASVVGWHIYEFFIAEKRGEDHETPTDHDIVELTKSLFKLEAEMNPYLEKIEFQGKTRSSKRDDHAAHALLHLSDHATNVVDPMSTINLMKQLHDNYALDTHVNEHSNAAQAKEELDFLQAILKTMIMQRTMRFLQAKELVTAEADAQLQLLKNIWFTPYSRGGGRIGSSGFEHVFLAEVKDQSHVLGLHNWVYFGEQEKLGNLDYKGYIEHVELGDGKHNKFLAAVRFSFHNIVKPYNTLFIGTSPELEMSLYTVCFLLSSDHPCPVQFGTRKFSIITHSWDWHGKKLIASAYPSLDV